jgi:hypothetical protein
MHNCELVHVTKREARAEATRLPRCLERVFPLPLEVAGLRNFVDQLHHGF